MKKSIILLFSILTLVSTIKAQTNKMEKATFGGGCFWCLEAVFEKLEGVQEVISGYAGGDIENPTYELVCSGKSGHAEVVQITFDPLKISYQRLLTIFFELHDPTTLNRQGDDIGTQYRSVVFYHDVNQESVVKNYIKELNAKGYFNDPIVTQVVIYETFYSAEKYHQGYYQRNSNQPYCRIVIEPKIKKMTPYF